MTIRIMEIEEGVHNSSYDTKAESNSDYWKRALS